MKLFNKFQSRAMQFSLELLNQLQRDGEINQEELVELTLRNGLEYPDQVLEPLCRAGVVLYDGKMCQLSPEVDSVRLPMGRMEKEYLSHCLDMPEAKLFLTEALQKKLRKICGDTNFFEPVQIIAPKGASLPERPGPDGFRTLLEAIRCRCLVEYIYRTKNSAIQNKTVALPWKLEYSAYDRRWWIILYAPSEQRTIKARLENLEQIKLLKPSGIQELEIEKAMERLLEDEPLVLQVHNIYGALERCFLVFEHQCFEETKYIRPGWYELSFRYYRFDRMEILRRLLYLGPAVSIVRPDSMKRELLSLLNMALDM